MSTQVSTSNADQIPEHKPYVPADVIVPEMGLGPIIVGSLLGIVFGASSLYLVLKVGMTVSASIPIAVLSITIFRAFRPLMGRNATILENNMVQTTGSAGESIAFGVGVTMPALLILGYNLELMRVTLVAVLGGLLGVLMMIPLRRVFIVKQHGKLVYPEGVACADVLIVGEKGGSSAATVFSGFGLAFLYEALRKIGKLWLEEPLRLLKLQRADGSTLFEFKGAAVSLETSPALLGVGYVIGPKIACIMAAGGVLSSWLLIPMIKLFGEHVPGVIYPGKKAISEMAIDEIWHDYVLYIGAGAVAAGGIISMMQSLPTIISSIRSGLRDLAGARSTSGSKSTTVSRIDRDMSMKVVLFGCIALILAIRLAPMLNINTVSAVLIVLFGFLFVTVSARLTGEVGSSSNPISGMTVATLLLTCLVFVAAGWSGENYRVAALSIAAIVCIACSNGGTVAQCLKTGYIVGGTPKYQQIGILIGTLTSALVIGSTLLLLNESATVYSKKDLPASQVNVAKLSEKERAGGEYASDTTDYFVLRAKDGDVEGVRAGKYLVNENGQICYLVDPGINGSLKVRDNGTKVDKFIVPKAALMSFIVDGVLTRKLPWDLVLLGVAIALVLELSGVPSLPFAVGVYLPMAASTPIFVGGIIRWIGDKFSKRSNTEADMSPGVLLSSGYIAGGTIMGIIAALIRMNPDRATALDVGQRWFGKWAESPELAMVPFGFLAAVLLYIGAKKQNAL